jgi:uncharacterized protein affecting Mg2+/Co2+ transport
VERIDGDGVISLYPIISMDMMQPFVYESCCIVSELGSTVSGWFLFEIVENCPRKGQSFVANVAPFALNIEPNTQLLDNPFFEPWMHF